MKRWAVLLSGRGSTARSFLESADPLEVVWVFSSRQGTLGVKRARALGIPVTEAAKPFQWSDLIQGLRDRRVTHLFLAGFMRILPTEVCQEWKGRILNIHPSLLPEFKGAQAMERSFADSEAAMGVSLHEVTEEMDGGQVVLQQKVVEAAEKQMGWTAVQMRMALAEQRLIRRRAQC